MSGPDEYELNDDDLNALDELRHLLKLKSEQDAQIALLKAKLKRHAHEATYLTVDGQRVASLSTSYPERFDTAALKAYDARLYDMFKRPADAPTVTLRLIGG